MERTRLLVVVTLLGLNVVGITAVAPQADQSAGNDGVGTIVSGSTAAKPSPTGTDSPVGESMPTTATKMGGESTVPPTPPAESGGGTGTTTEAGGTGDTAATVAAKPTPGATATPSGGQGTQTPGDGATGAGTGGGGSVTNGTTGNVTAGNGTASGGVVDSNLSDQLTVEGSPDISVFVPNKTIAPGERRTVVVQVVNAGTVETDNESVDPADRRRVTTARNVLVTLDTDDTPIEGPTGTVALGDIERGETEAAKFRVVVPVDAEGDSYDLPVEVEYGVESLVEGTIDRETETVTETVELVVTDRAQFEVDSVDADVGVGERDTATVEIENVGEADVTDAAVRLTSVNGDLQVDGGGAAERFVGDWDAGDDEEVEFVVNATNNAAPQDYAIRANVTYTDEDGTRRRSRPLVFGLTPDDEQTFELDDVEGDLEVDEDGTVEGDLSNEGPDAAVDAVLTIESPDEDVVPLREEFVLGDLDDGDDEAFEFPVRVRDGAEPGDRQFRFRVQYLDENGDPRASERLFGAVEVDPEEDEFELESVTQSLQAGTNGTVELTLRNERDEDLTEALVSVQSPNPDLQLSGAENASRFVGEWPDGESRSVQFAVQLTNGSTNQSYPLSATVAYRHEQDRNRSEPIQFGVTPAGEQQFRIDTVISSLAVSQDGRIRGRFTNLGPRNVSEAVLQLENATASIDPRETEFAADRLAVNESRRFSFPVDVRDTAEPGPRPVRFRVEYRDRAGDLQRTETLPVRVFVGPDTDEFAVRIVRNEVAAGSTGTVTVRIRNRRTVTLRNINAQVFVTEPLSTDDDQAFVASLAPNETVRLSFDVSASGQATPKTLPLKLDFQYEDHDGDTTLSDTYQVGVRVTESEGGLLGGVLSTAGVLVGLSVPALVGGSYLWHRRRE